MYIICEIAWYEKYKYNIDFIIDTVKQKHPNLNIIINHTMSEDSEFFNNYPIYIVLTTKEFNYEKGLTLKKLDENKLFLLMKDLQNEEINLKKLNNDDNDNKYISNNKIKLLVSEIEFILNKTNRFMPRYRFFINYCNAIDAIELTISNGILSMFSEKLEDNVIFNTIDKINKFLEKNKI